MERNEVCVDIEIFFRYIIKGKNNLYNNIYLVLFYLYFLKRDRFYIVG